MFKRKYASHVLLIVFFFIPASVGLMNSLLYGNEQPAGFVEKPSAISGENLPRVPVSIREGYEKYARLHPIRLLDVAPGGRGILVSALLGRDNCAQVYWLDAPQGDPRRLTDSREPIYEALFCPDSDRQFFVYLNDAGGAENYQVYRFDIKNRVSVMLTSGKGMCMNLLFSPDGRRLAYTSNERSGVFFDIYIMDPAVPGSGKLVHQSERSAYLSPACWFSDGSRLLFREYISANQVNSFILNIGTGAVENITPTADVPQVFSAGALSGDEKHIFGVTDRGGEFLQLFRLNLQTREITRVAQDIPWDVSDGEDNIFPTDPQKKHLAFLADEGGVRRAYLLDMDTLKHVPLESAPTGEIRRLKFDPSGERLFMFISTPRICGDVYAVALKPSSVTRWTRSDAGSSTLNEAALPEMILYPTFDSVQNRPRQIPAFYYQPVRKTERPFPVLILFHGGPESQYRPGFDAFESYLVNELGVALIAPNVRGSSGYGKSWMLLDNAEKREDSVKDVQGLLDWIAGRPELDKNRIAVYGGSYGGYMVLASLVHYSDRLACGVDLVGISNFVTFLRNTSGYRRDLRRVEYGDERLIGDFLLSISPAVNARKIQKPLFVLQGKNDPRVPVSEARQIVAAVRENSIPVWYMEAADEGHGFYKKDNEDYSNYSIILFFREFLLKPAKNVVKR